MITSIIDFINSIKSDLARWDAGIKPWFRGESGGASPLCPKIAPFDHFVATGQRVKYVALHSRNVTDKSARGSFTFIMLYLCLRSEINTR